MYVVQVVIAYTYELEAKENGGGGGGGGGGDRRSTKRLKIDLKGDALNWIALQ